MRRGRTTRTAEPCSTPGSNELGGGTVPDGLEAAGKRLVEYLPPPPLPMTSEPILVATGLPEMFPMSRGGDPRRHISYITRDLCIRLGHFDPDDPDNETDEDREDRLTRMELGSAFEDAVADRWARRYPDRYVRIGEIEKDDLIGNPDLVDTIDWAVVEVKLTWLSANHACDSEKFWKYWVQSMAYCWMLETNIVYLHVGHINGVYRPMRPKYRVWRREFTMNELAANWRMLRNHSDALMKVA